MELENFLLFEKSAFDFSPGLNVVSGETGAGKSLVARALGLALGGRGGHDVIRSGCAEARIRVVFRPGEAAGDGVRSLAGPDGHVRLERHIAQGGGGLTVNGKAVTAQAVRQTLAPLVDFAAQNEHMRLADPAYQLELLDAYGKLAKEAGAYAKAFHAAEAVRKRIFAGREERELVRLRRQRIADDLAVLREAAFNPEADCGLEDEIREMANAAAVVEAAAEVAARLEGGEPSALESLSAARRTAGKLAGVSPRLAGVERDLAAAAELAEAALAALADGVESIDASPERLDCLIARSEKLKALARRFSCHVEELNKIRERLEREEDELSAWDAGEDEAKAKLAELLPAVAEAGLRLGEGRRKAAAKLSRAVNRELEGLGMAGAGFEAAFEPLWSKDMAIAEILEAGPSGLDEVGFFLSPNPGEAPSAVASGASGGEASRAILALKTALSEVYRPEVMFLDEVDAGVGARLGRELAVKLKELAANRQVIVVTHLPQIASHADSHFKVAKRIGGGRTRAAVEKLEGAKRLEEVAKMIHGGSAGKVTMEQAAEMLAEGGNAV